MALTALQIAREMDTLVDKAGRPYFNDAKKTTFFNRAFNDVVQTEYERYESNDEHKLRILPLVRPFSKANSNQLILGTDIANFMYPLRIRAQFNGVDCDNQPIQFYSNVRPCQLDDFDVVSNDPFNKPIDRDPLYTIRNNGASEFIQVHSETIPILVEGDYLLRPTPFTIDTAGSPGTLFQFSDEVTHEIIGLAAAMMLGNIENYPAKQSIQQEIPQASGTFSN